MNMDDQELCSLGREEIKNGQSAKCKGKVIKKDEVEESTLRLIKIRSGFVALQEIFSGLCTQSEALLQSIW